MRTHAAGNSAAETPMARLTPTASSVPVQAILFARAGQPAPMEPPVAAAGPERARPEIQPHAERSDAEGERVGEGGAADAQGRKRPPAERERAREGNLHQRRGDESDRGKRGVAAAAQRAGE